MRHIDASRLFGIVIMQTAPHHIGSAVEPDLTRDMVDMIDATLLLRGSRLTKSQRASLVSGETSNIVVAGLCGVIDKQDSDSRPDKRSLGDSKPSAAWDGSTCADTMPKWCDAR